MDWSDRVRNRNYEIRRTGPLANDTLTQKECSIYQRVCEEVEIGMALTAHMFDT